VKLISFKPSLVTKAIFPNIKTPTQINRGQCFIWAYSSYLIFQGVELWHSPCHAFVRYRKRFYDAESLRGEENWQDLKSHMGGFATPTIVKHFKDDWGGNLERFHTSWTEIEKKAKKVLLHETSL
jgi:hypothetical protein